MFTEIALSDSLAEYGISNCSDIFLKLQDAYGDPGRHYHDRSHVAECLGHLSACKGIANRPREIEVAIWFHDAIYDTTKGDNEERSADWAKIYLDAQNVPNDAIGRIYDMIVATKSHTPKTDDEALLIDIDLGILGTSPQVFELYDEAIRREYHWVPIEQYVAGRVNVLQSFLDRSKIYHTDRFSDQLEAPARENLSRKISELSRG